MIFISAGHYPSRPGATFERFVEHDEAVIWAEQMVEKINSLVTVPLSLPGTLVPTGVLKDKVGYINERLMNGDIALEIHFNAAIDAKGNNVGRGCETLYYPGSDKGETLASTVQAALAQAFPPDRGVKEGWYRMDPSRGADFFLAKTKCPAIIIEPEFVHRSELIITNRDKAIGLMVDSLKEWIDGTESNSN